MRDGRAACSAVIIWRLIELQGPYHDLAFMCSVFLLFMCSALTRFACMATVKYPTKLTTRSCPPAVLTPSKRYSMGLCPLLATLKFKLRSPPSAIITAMAFTTIAISSPTPGARGHLKRSQRFLPRVVASGANLALHATCGHVLLLRRRLLLLMLLMLMLLLPPPLSTFQDWRATTVLVLRCQSGSTAQT